jgi:uncharacterized protein (DUF927 family)
MKQKTKKPHFQRHKKSHTTVLLNEHWLSDTSDGKTSMLFIAASAAGLIRAEGLPGWADSEPGLEDQAYGHRDCLLPLDESGDGNGKVPPEKKAKMLAFMIARNRPRRLSGQYESAHGLQGREYRIIAQSSSEMALTKMAIDAGKKTAWQRGSTVH